jgi:acetyl esterase/lipase
MRFPFSRQVWRFILDDITAYLVLGIIWLLCSIFALGNIGATYSALQELKLPHHSAGNSITKRSETYGIFDGKPVKLSIQKDTSKNSAQPAIIMVHGGAWVAGSRDTMSDWSKWFVSLGYTVFDIDYRLAPPATWQSAPGDVKCAIGWVKERADGFGINKDAITLFGSSAGGHLALLAGYASNRQIAPSCNVDDTKVAGVISVAGPTDLRAYYNPPPAWLTNQKKIHAFMGGSPEQYPERYRIASPISYVQARVPPTLLLYGTYDRLVPPSQSMTLANKLRAAHAPVVEVPLFGVNHGFEGDWKNWGSQKATISIKKFLTTVNP